MKLKSPSSEWYKFSTKLTFQVLMPKFFDSCQIPKISFLVELLIVGVSLVDCTWGKRGYGSYGHSGYNEIEPLKKVVDYYVSLFNLDYY